MGYLSVMKEMSVRTLFVKRIELFSSIEITFLSLESSTLFFFSIAQENKERVKSNNINFII